MRLAFSFFCLILSSRVILLNHFLLPADKMSYHRFDSITLENLSPRPPSQSITSVWWVRPSSWLSALFLAALSLVGWITASCLASA